MISRWSEKQRGFMKAIRIKRFKGFKDSGWLNLKPITLFFGYNSSGKSSILNALLMLKQSLSNYSKEVPFVFSKKNGVDLGGFEDIVYEKKIDHKSPIEIGLKLDIAEELKEIGYPKGIFDSFKKNPENSFNEIEFNFHITYNQKRRINVISLFEILNTINNKRILKMKLSQVSSNAIKKFESEEYEIKDLKIDINWYNFLPIIQVKSDPEHPLRLISEAINNKIIKYFQNLSNIGPVRAIPERTQQFIGEKPLTVGINGEEAFKLLYLSKYNEKNATESNLENQVNQWLENYNYKFQWNLLKGNLGQFILKDTRTEIEVSIKDVGFGISQVLPIVIQVFDPVNESTIIMEQPEIHLHSKAQSELADLFIKAIKKNQKETLIIETHSENLLLRLRRRIGENKLEEKNPLKINKNEVAVYYISNKDGYSKTTEIQFDDSGNFLSPPEEFLDFFSDDFQEILKISEITAKIKQKEQK